MAERTLVRRDFFLKIYSLCRDNLLLHITYPEVAQVDMIITRIKGIYTRAAPMMERLIANRMSELGLRNRMTGEAK